MLMWYWLGVLFSTMLIMSTVSLSLYAWDKRRAAKQGWRVPEKRLHLAALLGGWPGALIGQRWLRHKTVKRSFRLVFWGTVVLHVGVSALLTYVVYLEASAN
ncbi:DUF1294 domain-containing protein [Phycisphaeraceae bacterium D3-23]